MTANKEVCRPALADTGFLLSCVTRKLCIHVFATLSCEFFSKGLFLVVKGKLKIPIFVMIRPRGGDFLYSYEEFQVMIKEIEVFKSHAADGFVFGILTR